MARIKRVLGYTWAVLAVLIVAATFMGNNYFSRKLASAAGVTVSSRITGGEVVQVNDHGPYKAFVHRPVFDGLVGDRATGFIQINWESAGLLPPVIEERVELGGKRPVRLMVRLDTRAGEATAQDYSGLPLRVDHVYRLPSGFAVRVLLASR
jgi:hypothetical protein